MTTIFVWFCIGMIFVEPGLLGMYASIGLYTLLSNFFYKIYGGYRDGPDGPIDRNHVAFLMVGYAVVTTIATLILVAGDSLNAFSLKTNLSFWAVAIAALILLCGQPKRTRSYRRRDHQAYQGGGPSPNLDEPSPLFRPEHNCGYHECPHGGYHHPMCPYYRKHFTQ